MNGKASSSLVNYEAQTNSTTRDESSADESQQQGNILTVTERGLGFATRDTIKSVHEIVPAARPITPQLPTPPLSFEIPVQLPSSQQRQANQQQSHVRSHSCGENCARDPMIYPGIYAPSGIDMMGILVN